MAVAKTVRHGVLATVKQHGGVLCCSRVTLLSRRGQERLAGPGRRASPTSLVRYEGLLRQCAWQTSPYGGFDL